MSDELEELRKRLEALEAKVNPPPPPAPSKPFQHYDPTERMSPPVRLTGREVYKKQSIEEANMEYSKDKNPVGTLMPLAEWLKQRPQAAAPDPTPVAEPRVPRDDDKRPGQDLADAIAKGFADRELAAAIAEQLEIARKLKGL